MPAPPPTNRELEILKILWDRRKATVREIYDLLRPIEGELSSVLTASR